MDKVIENWFLFNAATEEAGGDIQWTKKLIRLSLKIKTNPGSWKETAFFIKLLLWVSDLSNQHE